MIATKHAVASESTSMEDQNGHSFTTNRSAVGVEDGEHPAGEVRVAAWCDGTGKPLPPGREPTVLLGESQVKLDMI